MVVSVTTFLATLVGFALYTHFSCAVATTATESGFAVAAILLAMKLIQVPRYESDVAPAPVPPAAVSRRLTNTPHAAPTFTPLHSFSSDIRTGPVAMCFFDVVARVVLSLSSHYWYVSSCLLFLIVSLVRPARARELFARSCCCALIAAYGCAARSAFVAGYVAHSSAC